MYLDFHAHFDSIDPVLIRTFIQNSEQNQTVTVFSGGNMGGNCYAPNEEVLRLCRKYAPCGKNRPLGQRGGSWRDPSSQR